MVRISTAAPANPTAEDPSQRTKTLVNDQPEPCWVARSGFRRAGPAACTAGTHGTDRRQKGHIEGAGQRPTKTRLGREEGFRGARPPGQHCGHRRNRPQVKVPTPRRGTLVDDQPEPRWVATSSRRGGFGGLGPPASTAGTGETDRRSVSRGGCLVARGGVEPPTYRFSGGRSYQLSYLAEDPAITPGWKRPRRDSNPRPSP